MKKLMITPNIGHRYFTNPNERTPFIIFDDRAWIHYALNATWRVSPIAPLARAAEELLMDRIETNRFEINEDGADRAERHSRFVDERVDEELFNFRLEMATAMESFVHDVLARGVALADLIDMFMNVSHNVWYSQDTVPINVSLQCVKAITTGVDATTLVLVKSYFYSLLQIYGLIVRCVEFMPYLIRDPNDFGHTVLCWEILSKLWAIGPTTVAQNVSICKSVARFTEEAVDSRAPSYPLRLAFGETAQVLMDMIDPPMTVDGFVKALDEFKVPSHATVVFWGTDSEERVIVRCKTINLSRLLAKAMIDELAHKFGFKGHVLFTAYTGRIRSTVFEFETWSFAVDK